MPAVTHHVKRKATFTTVTVQPQILVTLTQKKQRKAREALWLNQAESVLHMNNWPWVNGNREPRTLHRWHAALHRKYLLIMINISIYLQDWGQGTYNHSPFKCVDYSDDEQRWGRFISAFRPVSEAGTLCSTPNCHAKVVCFGRWILAFFHATKCFAHVYQHTHNGTITFSSILETTIKCF